MSMLLEVLGHKHTTYMTTDEALEMIANLTMAIQHAKKYTAKSFSMPAVKEVGNNTVSAVAVFAISDTLPI